MTYITMVYAAARSHKVGCGFNKYFHEAFFRKIIKNSVASTRKVQPHILLYAAKQFTA
jgi:hypothetical protein